MRIKKKCSKRNPEPPCMEGFEERTKKNGDICCYKAKKTKVIKSKKTNIITEIFDLGTKTWIYKYNKDTFDLTTFWGKKGNKLRSKTKKATLDEVLKLIKTKKKKGYKEIKS